MNKKDAIKTIVYKTLIGKKIKILKTNNKNLQNLKGTLIYETKNMFHIQTKNCIKKVIKNCIDKIEIEIDKNFYEVGCDLLKDSLINRIKKPKL